MLTGTGSGDGGDAVNGKDDAQNEEEELESSDLNEELLMLVKTVFDCLSGSQPALRPGYTSLPSHLTHRLLLPLTLTPPQLTPPSK